MLEYYLTPPGQPTRHVSYQGQAGSPQDAVIWLHGASGSGAAFLSSKIDGAAGRLDIGPDGLVIDFPSGSKTGWMLPGDELPLPPGVASDAYDLDFMRALISDIATRFPSVLRIWVCGFSSGTKLTWGLLSYNAEAGYPEFASIRGFFGGSNTLKFTNGWDTRTPLRRPVALWWGGAEDNPTGPGVYTFEDFTLLLGAMNGHTGATGLVTVKTACCGSGKSLKRANATGGTQTTRRFTRTAGGHEFTYCTGCKEYLYAIELFQENGFGT